MAEEEADSLKRTAPKQDRPYCCPQDEALDPYVEYRKQRPGSGSTHWTNPTDQPLTARFHVGPREGLDPRARKEMLTWTGKYLVTIKPGQTIELPSEWDDAVQTVRGGRIVAGHMPRARRVAGPPVELHPALDDQKAAPARRRRRPGGEG